jgi:hypothetical protein
MGHPHPHPPAVLLLAAFSRYEAALDWARRQAIATWGPVAWESPVYDFNQTAYYRDSMGPDLRKVFFALECPFDPAALADVKLQTNRWEDEYRAAAGLPEPRPLNLDPGYLTLAKLVLASTKEHSHRLYLRDGIYAEVTLYYSAHHWQAREWTYADYRRPDFQEFFSRCRDGLHDRLRQETGS